jgi:hypothetical protein
MRLTPYPKKPIAAIPVRTAGLGNVAVLISASPRFAAPATNPLIIAICRGSAEESLRVRLLSTPHAKQAPAIASAPRLRRVGPPCQDSIVAPARMANAPVKSRRSTFSWNHSHAIAIVARPSRFKSKAALEADVYSRPNIRRTGPITPPLRTTSTSQGKSERRRGASAPEVPTTFRAACSRARPSPELKYRRPARTHGVHSAAQEEFSKGRAGTKQSGRGERHRNVGPGKQGSVHALAFAEVGQHSASNGRPARPSPATKSATAVPLKGTTLVQGYRRRVGRLHSARSKPSFQSSRERSRA